MKFDISNLLFQSSESNDTLGGLPTSMNLIDFGGRSKSGPGSVRVSVLEAFDPLLTESNDVGEWFVCLHFPLMSAGKRFSYLFVQ